MYPTIGYTDKPGTLTLRTKFPMEYSRTVLSNKWYLKREAEPKDNELWSGDKPNLHQGTYKQISKDIASDKVSGKSESHTAQEGVFQQIAQQAHKDPTREMVDMINKKIALNSINAYGGKVLPRHASAHEKRHLETTYNKDFVNPRPELIAAPKSEAQLRADFEKSAADNSFAFRKMQSQFTDLDSPKRDGINTFYVQHGEYPNQILKSQFQAKNQNNLFNA